MSALTILELNTAELRGSSRKRLNSNCMNSSIYLDLVVHKVIYPRKTRKMWFIASALKRVMTDEIKSKIASCTKFRMYIAELKHAVPSMRSCNKNLVLFDERTHSSSVLGNLPEGKASKSPVWSLDPSLTPHQDDNFSCSSSTLEAHVRLPACTRAEITCYTVPFDMNRQWREVLLIET